MRQRNTPVPPAPRAPVNARWLWYIGPPAAIVAAYRMIPPRVRRTWSHGSSTSHIAQSAILAGYGWRAFWTCATPPRADHPDFPGSWLPFGPSDGDPFRGQWKSVHPPLPGESIRSDPWPPFPKNTVSAPWPVIPASDFPKVFGTDKAYWPLG